MQTDAFPASVLPVPRGSGSMSTQNVFKTTTERHLHSDSRVLCQRINIFRIIVPKSVQLPEITRGQESLKQCNNYTATSTCFLVNKEKKSPVTTTI